MEESKTVLGVSFPHAYALVRFCERELFVVKTNFKLLVMRIDTR